MSYSGVPCMAAVDGQPRFKMREEVAFDVTCSMQYAQVPRDGDRETDDMAARWRLAAAVAAAGERQSAVSMMRIFVRLHCSTLFPPQREPMHYCCRRSCSRISQVIQGRVTATRQQVRL